MKIPSKPISPKGHALLERRAKQRAVLDSLTGDWFAEQRAFYDSPDRLLAALCGRRAGKTRGLAAHYVRQAVTKPGSRQLYINTTRDEARKLFWIGPVGDGVFSLVDKLGIPAHPDHSRLELHFEETDSWIYLKGAKDEVELSKALGDQYDEVTWDEAQKIRPQLATTIREVLMAALLDRQGRLRLTGTANRQQSGLFFDITKPNSAVKNWTVFRWNMLANPHFGRAAQDPKDPLLWWVYALRGKDPVSGPWFSFQVDAAVAAARMKYGIEQLASDLGVPIDSPIIQREGFGIWTAEDSSYVYHVRKMLAPFYAPARLRYDGFPDIELAIKDLPYDYREGFFAMGADLGMRDAFAMHCWSWHPNDPNLYEVFSWKREGLDNDQQFAAIREVREILPVGLIVMDAGGQGLQINAAWTKVFEERYAQPIVAAEKHQKQLFIDLYNTDITNERIRFRDGSETHEEMLQLQWSKLVTGSGRLIEDPTMDNHCCDASLYAHRASYQYRFVPAEPKPKTEQERLNAWEKEIEDVICNPRIEEYPSISSSFLGRGRYLPR